MKRYNKVTPEGTQDFLFEQCRLIRSAQEMVKQVFEKRGYNEVITPGLEYYDVFRLSAGTIDIDTMYKLTDRHGRLLVLRPDCTTPIARLVATRLKSSTLPIRLYYNQNIYRMTPALSGRSDEINQIGIELIGAAGKKADLEILLTAAHAMEACELQDYRIEIGHVQLFDSLMHRIDAEEMIKEDIRSYIDAKNYGALNVLLDQLNPSKAVDALRRLPTLFGGEEIFAAARTLFDAPEELETLDYIESIYQILSASGLGGKVMIDLGLVNQNEYYTGVVFRGYAQRSGEAVLSGGRYDRLLSDFGENLPAIGFALNINEVANSITRTQGQLVSASPQVLIHCSGEEMAKAVAYADRLTRQGLLAEISVQESIEDARIYAAEKRIAQLHIFKNGQIVQEVCI